MIACKTCGGTSFATHVVPDKPMWIDCDRCGTVCEMPKGAARTVVRLVADVPLCLEYDGGPCDREATREIEYPLHEGRGALCEAHAANWPPSRVRPMTDARRAKHFFSQSRPGGRLRPKGDA